MTNISAKKFSWLPSPSAWQQTQNWRAKRQAMVADFQNTNDGFLAGFGNAMSNQLNGQAELTTQIVMGRLQAQAQAKTAQFAAISKAVSRLA